MTGNWAKSAAREWSGLGPAPEESRTPSFTFRVPQQIAIVHADPW